MKLKKSLIKKLENQINPFKQNYFQKIIYNKKFKINHNYLLEKIY